jgi:hypothetical protein
VDIGEYLSLSDHKKKPQSHGYTKQSTKRILMQNSRVEEATVSGSTSACKKKPQSHGYTKQSTKRMLMQNSRVEEATVSGSTSVTKAPSAQSHEREITK